MSVRKNEDEQGQLTVSFLHFEVTLISMWMQGMEKATGFMFIYAAKMHTTIHYVIIFYLVKFSMWDLNILQHSPSRGATL